MSHLMKFRVLSLIIALIACQPAEPRMTETQRAAIADTVRALTNEAMAAFDLTELSTGCDAA